MPAKNIREVKTGLRGKYRRLKEDLLEEEKLRLDSEIQSRLLSLREYSQADTVSICVSKEPEVGILAIAQAVWANQKRVAAPRCIPRTRDTEFYHIRSRQDLERVPFGVMEPIVQCRERVEDESRSFRLVSDFSLDVQGFRLGYGGGYYNRFPSRLGGFMVGVCYPFCVWQNLPHGYYDRSVDLLVTKKCARRISKKARQGVCHTRRRQSAAKPRPGGPTAEPDPASQGRNQ